MGIHSTPCKYVHHWCHLCSSPGPARIYNAGGSRSGTRALLPARRQSLAAPAPLPGLQQQGGNAPTATWSWPAGWTHGALPSLAVPCSWGPTKGHRCHEGVPWSVREGFGEERKVFPCTWTPQLATPYCKPCVSFGGGSRSHSVLSYGRRCVALPARQRAPPPRPLLKWVSWARKSQSSSVGSPSGQGLFPREGRRSPGLCLNTCGGLPLPPAACVHARTHTHTHSNTRMHTHRWKKPTTWIIFCAI